MAVSTVTLTVGDTAYPQLQIWGHATYKLPNVEFVAYVYYHRIPLFLVAAGPFDVYSELEKTEKYFASNLMARGVDIGILTRFSSPDSSSDEYAVFYADTGAVKCFSIDFGTLTHTQSLKDEADTAETSIYFGDRPRTITVKSDTTVFDRVLEGKLTKKPPVARNTPQMAPLLVLSTSGQISQVINKTILSGLRLRGLSRSAASSKERVATGEIYQMTKKAAHFALRKYNYDFNTNTNPTEIKASDVQDIVERLLEVFVDVEAAGKFS